jgi:exoribonuclease-2
LLDDGLHFVRKGGSWTPRTRTAVEDLRTERIRVAERERQTRELFAALEAARRGEAFAARGNEVERRYLGALEELALHGQTTPDGVRNIALQALEAAGQRWTRPHEGAFRLLRAIGRFASDDENLQVPRFGLRTEFPPEVLARADERVRAGFDRSGRADLTGLEAISIDSPYTKEIDDLLSLERRQDGGVRLGVHIADPAAFVEPGDPVDEEALVRGLTYYMPDLRLPMLPPAISEEAASLLPEAVRPALSFLLEVDEAGGLAGFEILRSIVRSSARIDYLSADRAIDSGEGTLAGLLRELAALGRLRLAARVGAGAISIRAPEAEVHVEEDGTIRLERMSEDSASRLAVTEAMVLAGEAVARFCIDSELPAIFRRQSAPGELPEPAGDGAWDPVATRRARRSLKRAESGLKPGAHAGLGLDAYVQASSPLRRFQDLAIHRQLISALGGQPPCYDRAAMQRVASTTDRAEADARRAERSADEYWLLRYLEDRQGQTLDAWVVETEPRPVILLDETLVEQPLNGLAGVEPGQRIRVRVEQVSPRAGLLALRRLESHQSGPL